MLFFWRRKTKDKPKPAEAAPEPFQHSAVVQATAAMTRDPEAQQRVARHGLQILSLTWEDTARTQGSAFGPNISDMTIRVDSQGTTQSTCMPVIRPPNFTDRTCDLRLDDFFLLVGNERGAPLQRISLRSYLGDLRRHLTRPDSWKGDHRSLLAARDTHVLVSAQACFLPVPQRGLAEFTPALFNYQSSAGNPAVLTVLVTREGTSATIIDNTRDGFSEGYSRGQRLYFNNSGKKAALTGQRLTDFVTDQTGAPATAEDLEAARKLGLNTILLVQVPLKARPPAPRSLTTTGAFAVPCPAAPGGGPMRGASDVEEAVIGHGRDQGPFVEIDGLPIERDERFPIRVTVQFYKATSNGVLDDADAAAIAAQVERVYAEASYVGSLVVDGDMGRPTAWK